MLVKYMIVGDMNVGKSSIVMRYKNNTFGVPEQTIGVDYFVKNVHIMNQVIRISIWDTGGQELFRPIIRSYYTYPDIILLVYDVTNKQSFDNLDNWMADIKYHQIDAHIILIGNKSDDVQNRKVSMHQGLEYAKNKNIPLFETSAKLNTNIDNVFDQDDLIAPRYDGQCTMYLQDMCVIL